MPGYSYLSLFSISFLFCMGMATIQLRLRTWFGHRCGLERLLAVPGIAEPAFTARDTALTIMTTSLEMLQIKPFSSKRYPSDLVRQLLQRTETCRRHFIIQLDLMNMLTRPTTTTTYQSQHKVSALRCRDKNQSLGEKCYAYLMELCFQNFVAAMNFLICKPKITFNECRYFDIGKKSGH